MLSAWQLDEFSQLRFRVSQEPPKLSRSAGMGGRQQNMLLKDLTKNSTSIGMAVNASNATVASNQATLNNAAGVTSSSADVRVTTRRVTW